MALAGARALLDLLFPPRCAVCGAHGMALCAECLGAIQPLPAPRCARCDMPAPRLAAGLCQPCARGAHLPALDRLRMAARYEGQARAAIHAFKYSGKRRLAVPLARLLESAWRDADLDANLIIPMALHPRRLRERGYNQSALLARELGRALRLPVLEHLLLRTRATSAQAQLPLSARYTNVAGAFALADGAQRALAGRRILLLDDIITSGATVQAAASALRAVRPAAIYALALAHPFHARVEMEQGDGASREGA
ncbi:MAG TPA: ComF family protein [Ktedonobacterales bacterium]